MESRVLVHPITGNGKVPRRMHHELLIVEVNNMIAAVAQEMISGRKNHSSSQKTNEYLTPVNISLLRVKPMNSCYFMYICA
jgi:hypothetical protein